VAVAGLVSTMVTIPFRRREPEGIWGRCAVSSRWKR